MVARSRRNVDARAATPTPIREVVLDADGLSKLIRRDRVVRAMIQEEVIAAGSRLFVPMVTVTQALADGANRDEVQQVLRGARGEALDDFGTSLLAARLIIVTGHLDVVDATVAAEALRRVPSIVITSDAGDIRLLLDADPRGKRVEVWKV